MHVPSKGSWTHQHIHPLVLFSRKHHRHNRAVVFLLLSPYNTLWSWCSNCSHTTSGPKHVWCCKSSKKCVLHTKKLTFWVCWSCERRTMLTAAHQYTISDKNDMLPVFAVYTFVTKWVSYCCNNTSSHIIQKIDDSLCDEAVFSVNGFFNISLAEQLFG